MNGFYKKCDKMIKKTDEKIAKYVEQSVKLGLGILELELGIYGVNVSKIDMLKLTAPKDKFVFNIRIVYKKHNSNLYGCEFIHTYNAQNAVLDQYLYNTSNNIDSEKELNSLVAYLKSNGEVLKV